MADNREKISTGPNARPLNESIAGTAPRIPNEARVPGKEPSKAPTEAEDRRIRETLGAPLEEVDTLPLDGE